MEFYVIYEISTGDFIGLVDASIDNIRTDHASRIPAEHAISTNTITTEKDAMVMPWMIVINSQSATYNPDASPPSVPEPQVAIVS